MLCCPSCGRSPLSSPLISPWQHPLLPLLPSCSYRSKMFAKTSAVTRHSCPRASPLICLSCADIRSLTFSYKTILGLCPIKAPSDVPWQGTRGKWWSISADESDGTYTEMKRSLAKAEEDKIFNFYSAGCVKEASALMLLEKTAGTKTTTAHSNSHNRNDHVLSSWMSYAASLEPK